jgi:oligopeptidase B
MRVRASLVLGWLVFAQATIAGAATPPVAKKIPHEFHEHGAVRTDEYFWLRERENPEVVAYLEAENAYLAEVMAPTDSLQTVLFQEITGRLKRDDASVPVFARGWWFYTRYVEGGEYALHCRRPGSMDGPEQIVLDGNALAKGQSYFALSGVAYASDNRIVSYAVDTVGRRKYTRRFRDLATGLDLPDTIAGVTSDGVWAEDGRTFLYVRQDPQTLRAFQVWRHELGTDPARDILVFQEDDETFDVSVDKTKSRRFLTVTSSQTLATEVRYIDAQAPAGDWRVFVARRRGHEYEVDHVAGRWVIHTNLEARNFRLMTCAEGATGTDVWRELIPHRDDVLLEGFEAFTDHLVLAERRGGLVHLRVRGWDGRDDHDLAFGDPTYAAWLMTTPEPDSPILRFGYSSLTTPASIYDYDLRTGEQTLRKRDEVVGAFDPAWYSAEYVHATASDGTKVPISLVYRRDRFARGQNPCLLYGYGSYGASESADFSTWYLSLLDRGFVIAIAHVRGGSEMGRAWYEDGKLLKKMNTFTDFIACGRHLAAAGYADPAHLYGMGGSAGGLLMGAVVNLAPDLWDGVVAQVPFVDVVTTMLDASIPLTTSEYDEWGDPRDKTYYDVMLSYSPYDQVERKAYPDLLVTTGLHDSQVQYWEPAKWVARLRDRKTDANLLLLHTNLTAGHGGASGRFERYRETALAMAFMLRLAQTP